LQHVIWVRFCRNKLGRSIVQVTHQLTSQGLAPLISRLFERFVWRQPLGF
jgi:hypothetical protein